RLTPVATPRRAQRGAFSNLPGSAALVISYGLFGLGLSTYTGYLVAATRDRGFTEAHSLLLSSLMGGAMAVSFIVGRLSDSIGRRRTVVAGTLALALSSLAVPWAGEPWIGATAVLAGAFLSGTGATVGAYLGD